jgi:prophage DNA circulation protein
MTDFDLIPEASYRGILFPVESADVDGGTDFVEHTAYRRRGADMEPAGLKAYKGSLTIPLLNTGPLVQRYGTLWPDLRADLVQMFADNPIGTLIHPTWGSLEVAILSWATKDAPEIRNGQRLTVQWQEHNASLAALIALDGAVTTDPTTTVQSLATTADTLSAGKAGYVPLAPLFISTMTLLESSLVLPYSEVQGAFSSMFALLNAALALPSMTGLDAAAAYASLLTLRVSLQGYYARFAPGISSVRSFVVPAAMGVCEIAASVYGDISKTSLLYAANSFADPLLVPAGTVVTVLPS